MTFWLCFVCSSLFAQDLDFGKKIIKKLHQDILWNKLEKPELIWAEYFHETEKDPDWRKLFYVNLQLYVNFIKTHKNIVLRGCLETRVFSTEPCDGEQDSDYEIMVMLKEGEEACGAEKVAKPHVHKFVIAFNKNSGRIASISPASE